MTTAREQKLTEENVLLKRRVSDLMQMVREIEEKNEYLSVWSEVCQKVARANAADIRKEAWDEVKGMIEREIRTKRRKRMFQWSGAVLLVAVLVVLWLCFRRPT